MKKCPLAVEFTATGWNDPIEQIWAAAYRMRRDAEAISMIKRQDGVGTDDKPFLPTFSTSFMLYLTNSPKAAVAIMNARAKADQVGQAGKAAGDRSIADVLDEALTQVEVNALIERLNELAETRAERVSFGTRATPVSLKAAVTESTSVLAACLKRASELIAKHAPDAVVAAGPAPRPDTAPEPQPAPQPEEGPSSAPTSQPGAQPAPPQAPGPPPAAGPVGGPLGQLIAAHESGKAGYNAFNRGRAQATPEKIDFSTMSLHQVMAKQALPRQHRDRLFAVGKYQIIPTTMKAAVQALRIDPNQKFAPELQEFLFRAHLIRPQAAEDPTIRGGQRRRRRSPGRATGPGPGIRLRGLPVHGALFLCGIGRERRFDLAAKVAKALAEERQSYRAFEAKGKKADEAWMALCGIPIAAFQLLRRQPAADRSHPLVRWARRQPGRVNSTSKRRSCISAPTHSRIRSEGAPDSSGSRSRPGE